MRSSVRYPRVAEGGPSGCESTIAGLSESFKAFLDGFDEGFSSIRFLLKLSVELLSSLLVSRSLASVTPGSEHG